jgi:hypothetical protein
MKGNIVIASLIALPFFFLGIYEIKRALKQIQNPNKEFNFSLILWSGGGINNGWVFLIRGILIILTILIILLYLIFK